MRVDSELATKTNTSASKQNLSIQLSSSVVTSVPGLLRTESKNSYLHSKEVVYFYKLIKIEWKCLISNNARNYRGLYLEADAYLKFKVNTAKANYHVEFISH